MNFRTFGDKFFDRGCARSSQPSPTYAHATSRQLPRPCTSPSLASAPRQRTRPPIPLASMPRTCTPPPIDSAPPCARRPRTSAARC
ncbi:hypothetical protein FA95DRAFT_1559445 [Auriscalpium vulgare]|uniref:Uncharacterized protein n=1 Tax=Auriscalpium vulgare TaxID=40419 RepID=A0ACB8RSX2_9AGAM|nr:hypothetical protein FA95DRAFT_1559445 [Auriscalpium vulgare]